MYNIRKKRKRQNKKIPLRQGGHRWNIYRVSNYILNGKKDNDVHGGLVIDEINDNVILVEVTHSSRWGKKNNQSIRNINSKDIDENGILRKSYFKNSCSAAHSPGWRNRYADYYRKWYED